MNRETVKYFILAMSVTLFATGLLMTLQTLRETKDVSARMSARIKQIEGVRRLHSEIANYNAALSIYEGVPECRLRPVSISVKETFPEFRADTIKDYKREAMPGWNYYEKEISFGDAEISSVLEVLRRLELQRPPWRLMKCLIKASSRQAGTGTVIVTVEGIERSSAK